MFYDTSSFIKPAPHLRDDRFHALVMLLPRESKRLLAKAVLQMPEVKRSLEDGWFVISRGVTPAYLLEELTGQAGDKGNSTAGIVAEGRLASVVEEDRLGPWVFENGKPSEIPAPQALGQFRACDVSIKGANAVDPNGNIGVLAADGGGGTVGGIWGTLTARGSHWVAPVSLERLIPDVVEAARVSGNHLWDLTMGQSAGLMPVVNAQVVTEVEAIAILTGVKATHIASGGVAGSEGAVMLSLSGAETDVRAAFDMLEDIKGEEQFESPRLIPYIREPETSPQS
ncbi:MAG: hypothetical protein QGF24_00860 [Dehalococcoidia bacterium]|jgi:hypothetical protein|nr:hypothetical protein [Dehalococcoidia bacterium]|tara:strand:+ start:208 stop:1059 length:852 start_codon:yes stop_codon:yes gene_type:complete